MTSPQVYEEVHNPFTALNFVDFVSGSLGVLYIHDGAQGMLRDGSTVRNLLTMYDAWDEDYFVASLDARMRIMPHRELTNSERWRRAQEFNRPPLVTVKSGPGGDIPSTFAGFACQTPGVAATAFYREAEGAGRHCTDYAGKGMQFPYVLRLVELDGSEAQVSLHLPGRVAADLASPTCAESAWPSWRSWSSQRPVASAAASRFLCSRMQSQRSTWTWRWGAKSTVIWTADATCGPAAKATSAVSKAEKGRGKQL
jgi:alpha-mannosidase